VNFKEYPFYYHHFRIKVSFEVYSKEITTSFSIYYNLILNLLQPHSQLISSQILYPIRINHQLEYYNYNWQIRMLLTRKHLPD
jgi:hypothetical protein